MNIGIIFLGIGVLLLLVSLFVIMRRRKLVESGERASAIVVKSLTGNIHGSRTLYFPVVKYRAHNGQEYEVRYNIGSEKRKYKDGESVEIIYRSENPQKIIFANTKGHMIFSGIIGFWGLILLASGTVFLLLF